MAAMKRDMARLDSLNLDPANVRMHPARNLEAIKASLARFGQQKPIVVDGDGIVRAGNGTVMAARDLGWAEVWVVRTKLKGVEAAAFAIADNRSAELASWDDPALARTLEAIRSEPDFPIGATGFDDAEIDALLEGIAREHAAANGEVVDDPAGEWEGMPEFQHRDERAFRTLIVHFPDADAVAEFADLIGQSLTDQTKTLWHPPQPKNIPGSAIYVDDDP